MSKKLTFAIFMAINLFFQSIQLTHAFDERVVKMNLVLTQYHSPMAGLEKELIKIAIDNDLDWTLMVAIAGTESSFGKHMPTQCINPYGWGIYGQNKLCFKSFIQAANTVAYGLKTKYNTTSLSNIAKTYNTANTQAWLKHTQFFINKIKNQPIPVSQLPLTL